MTALGRSLAKPPRQALNAALVTPSDAHLWKALTFLAPLWGSSGSGVSADVSGRAMSNLNTGAFTVGARGAGWRFSTVGASKFLRWPSLRRYHLDGNVAWSMFLAVDIAAWSSTSTGPIGASNSTTTDGLWRLNRATSGADLSFVWRTGGANSSVTWTAAFTNMSGSGLGFHTFCVTRRVGGTWELFVDGKSLGTKTGTAAPAAGTHDVTLGTTGSANASAGVTGLYYLAAIWQGRALAAGSVRQLHADPFALLRVDDGARVVYDRYVPATRLAPGIRLG